MHEELVGLSKDLLLKIAPEATHQHYKGGLYRKIGEGIHTETEEKLVYYVNEFPYGDEEIIFARPTGMFYGFTEDNTKRFQPLK